MIIFLTVGTWKPTWRKLQVPNVNTHNMQEDIHWIDKEQHQKEKLSRKLIKQSFCWTPSCTFKIQFSRVLLWWVEIAPGAITHSIFMWTQDKVVLGGWDISGVRDISPPCEPALSLLLNHDRFTAPWNTIYKNIFLRRQRKWIKFVFCRDG